MPEVVSWYHPPGPTPAPHAGHMIGSWFWVPDAWLHRTLGRLILFVWGMNNPVRGLVASDRTGRGAGQLGFLGLPVRRPGGRLMPAGGGCPKRGACVNHFDSMMPALSQVYWSSVSTGRDLSSISHGNRVHAAPCSYAKLRVPEATTVYCITGRTTLTLDGGHGVFAAGSGSDTAFF